MNNHTTIEKMKLLRLHGMAQVHYAAVNEKMYADYTLDELCGASHRPGMGATATR